MRDQKIENSARHISDERRILEKQEQREEKVLLFSASHGALLLYLHVK